MFYCMFYFTRDRPLTVPDRGIATGGQGYRHVSILPRLYSGSWDLQTYEVLRGRLGGVFVGCRLCAYILLIIILYLDVPEYFHVGLLGEGAFLHILYWVLPLETAWGLQTPRPSMPTLPPTLATLLISALLAAGSCTHPVHSDRSRGRPRIFPPPPRCGEPFTTVSPTDDAGFKTDSIHALCHCWDPVRYLDIRPRAHK